MFYLREMCCLCLSATNVPLNNLNFKNEDNLTHFEKMSSIISQLTSIIEINFDYKVCKKCSDIVNTIYKVNQLWIKSLNKITFYGRILNKKSAHKKPSNLNVTINRIQNVEIGETAYLNLDNEVCSDNQLKNEADSEAVSAMDIDSNILSDVIVKQEPDDCLVSDEDNFLEYEIKTEAYDIKDECLDRKREEFQELQHQNSVLEVDPSKQGFNANFYYIKTEDVFEKSCVDQEPDTNILEYKNSIFIQPEIDIKLETEDDDDKTENEATRVEIEIAEPNVNTLNEAGRSCESSDSISQSEHIENSKEDNGNEMHRCNVCNKVFAQERYLNAHKRTKKHYVKTTFNCDTFKKIFTNKTQHKVTAFECHVCKKSFKWKSILDKHKLTHTNEKPFSCDICKKEFKRKWSLTAHKSVHTDESMKCQVCQDSFTSKIELARHNIIHSNKKLIKCDLCEKLFIHPNGLYKHKLKHTGQKHECDVCHKTFTLKENLGIHKRVHTGEKPYHCDKCNKSFTQLTHLNQHRVKWCKSTRSIRVPTRDCTNPT